MGMRDDDEEESTEKRSRRQSISTSEPARGILLRVVS